MTPRRLDGAPLVVVGDASIDYFVRVPHLAGNDNKTIGTLIGVHGGGMSANLAAAAAAHGADVGLVTRIGDDLDSVAAMAELRRLGVNLDDTITVPGGRTWLCFIQLDASGEKALVGADTGVKTPELADITLPAASTTSIVVPLTDDVAWAAAVADRAADLGHAVAIDLEPDAAVPGDEYVERLLARSDIVFVNRDAAARFGDGPEDAATSILARGPHQVVVSFGRDGAYGFSRDGTAFHASAVGRITAIDTTGAGDALAGGTLGALTRGLDFASAVRAGVATATRCIRHVGSRTYLADRNPPAIDVRVDPLRPRNETS